MTPGYDAWEVTVLLDHAVGRSEIKGELLPHDRPPFDKEHRNRQRKLVNDGSVTWVTGSAKDDEDPMGHQQQVKPNRFSSQYVAYGNQAILEHSYMINGLPGRRGGAGHRTWIRSHTICSARQGYSGPGGTRTIRPQGLHVSADVLDVAGGAEEQRNGCPSTHTTHAVYVIWGLHPASTTRPYVGLEVSHERSTHACSRPKEFSTTVTSSPSIGTLQLPDDSFELFYGKGSPSTFINISKTANSPGSLDALQSACEPVKFGRGDKTVLDESYRKAGKMDTSDFMLRHSYPFPRVWTDEDLDPLDELPGWLKGTWERCGPLRCDEVTWVTGGAKDDVDKYGTPVRQPNQFSSQYVAYGNEASLDNFYMTACMTVPIAPASDRKPTQVGAKAGNGFQDGGGETAGAGRIVTLRVVEKA
ncbi:hypothetical protein OH76DRAFT_1421886 [Lentinus brumalis]|uniref:Uncharacterized protein n=1 Tax=Lentinus brumalis TaxID=2498619 RepID=A0A371CTD4_9APHY|nr:hypothetical protein OH76DRAFT_1421886 [Polyporus brumalis]